MTDVYIFSTSSSNVWSPECVSNKMYHLLLSAVDSDVFYTNDAGAGIQFSGPVTPLVTLATKTRSPGPFPVPLQPISSQEILGFGFNFYNNMWDTNYIYYYPYSSDKSDADFKAFFRIKLLRKWKVSASKIRSYWPWQ